MTASQTWSGIYGDHPIRPAEAQDPLALLNKFRTSDPTGGTAINSARPHVGFACLWEDPPEHTWSYSAWNLRAALRLTTDTTDIGIQIPRLSRTILKAGHVRYRGGRLTTTWSYSRLTDTYNTRALFRGLSRSPAARRCDAVLMIDDIAALSVPFFVYYDSSWDALISAADSPNAYAALRLIAPSTMARRRERQLAVYERATGVVAMSEWLARSLVEQSGVPPHKVHVVHPGLSAGRALHSGQLTAGQLSERQPHRPLPERTPPRRRLLFIGRQYHAFDFYRKGGDLVVAALTLLRREYDPRITLTVAGPEKWPLPGPPPDGVCFVGSLPPDQITSLYDSHDLFVMPSRLEPFGVVFAEALSRGLPCIARNAYAMPEIVTPNLSGILITGNDKHELAATIATALADDELYQTCRQRASEVAAYFSWERAASQMTRIISASLNSGTTSMGR